MPLPVLNARGGATPTDLLRYFAKAELHWTQHVAEAEELEFGVALTSREFPGVFFANRMLNAALPEGMTAAQVVTAAEAHFARAGLRCQCWTLDPAAPGARTDALGEHLSSLGFRRDANDVMYLQGTPAAIQEVGNLSIIPARASFRHVRELLTEALEKYHHPPLAEASMLHLDDPHVDALIALRDGAAAAYVAVLSVGDVGAIEEVFVSAAYRNQGIGRTMMSRALEICARSQFRHVFIEVDPENVAAKKLYEDCGFRKIGEMVSFDAPQARP
jgi:ribosomal protein S18 acetylase RimI-like enzyme